MMPHPIDWPEDFQLENGQYQCRCVDCGCTFIGYKRRVICKVCHEKFIASFVPFTADFDYEKEFYDVLLPSGELVKHCWPNAGMMNAVNGDARKWTGADGVMVRLSTDGPLNEVVVVGDPPGREAILKAAVAMTHAQKNKGVAVVMVDDTKPAKPKLPLLGMAALAAAVGALPTFKSEYSIKALTKCLLPSCDRTTRHNGGYCSAEHCNLHRHQLRGGK